MPELGAGTGPAVEPQTIAGTAPVHVYAPRSVRAFAIVDHDCTPRPSRRPCGSYHAVVRLYEWHDPDAVCCGCGTHAGTGRRLSTQALERLRAEHAQLVADGAVMVRDGDYYVPRSGENDESA